MTWNFIQNLSSLGHDVRHTHFFIKQYFFLISTKFLVLGKSDIYRLRYYTFFRFSIFQFFVLFWYFSRSPKLFEMKKREAKRDKKRKKRRRTPILSCEPSWTSRDHFRTHLFKKLIFILESLHHLSELQKLFLNLKWTFAHWTTTFECYL